LGNEADAAAMGANSVAVAVGYASKAKGVKGNWLVLAEWENGKVKSMGVAHIDGIKIKADTWYMIRDRKFVEVG
jgi:hypothetical protein